MKWRGFFRKQESQSAPNSDQGRDQHRTTYGRAAAPQHHGECCHHACRASDPEHCPNRSRYWPPKTAFEFWQILLNFLLVAVSGGMMAFACNDVRLTRDQLKETQKQGRQTERVLALTQRARAVIAGATMEKPFEAGEIPRVALQARNDGVSTASEVRVFVQFRYTEEPPTDVPAIAECRAGGSVSVIGPNGNYTNRPHVTDNERVTGVVFEAVRVSAIVNTPIGSSWTRGSVHRERSASDAGRVG